MKPRSCFQDWLLAPLCWMLVVGIAIGSALVVSHGFPRWPKGIVWTCGLVVFVLGVLVADWILRAIRWGTGIGAPTDLRRPTPERLVSDLISQVLTNDRVQTSRVMRRWPTSSNDPLTMDAKRLLEECADPPSGTFDQRKVRERFQALVEIMNRLRE